MSEIDATTEFKIESLKSTIESVLRSPKFVNDSFSSSLTDSLSTNPMRVGSNIDSNSLYGMCGTLSYELGVGLKDAGITTEQLISDDEDNNAHVYLATKETDQPIIIDPSIGQFIEGHNHIFVGTRQQLKDLVVNQTGEFGKYKITHTRSRNNPEEAYRRIWGINGRKYGRGSF